MGDNAKRQLIESLVAAEFAMRKPKTMEDYAAIAARIDLTTGGHPVDDRELLARAAAVAEGFFGHTFVSDPVARAAFIDAVEHGMREALQPDVNLRRFARGTQQ